MKSEAVRVSCADGDVTAKLDAVYFLGQDVVRELRRERDEKFAYYLDFRTESRKTVKILFEQVCPLLRASRGIYPGHFSFPSASLPALLELALRQNFSSEFIDDLLWQALRHDCLPAISGSDVLQRPEIRARLVFMVLSTLINQKSGSPPGLPAEFYQQLWPHVFSPRPMSSAHALATQRRLQRNFLLSFRATGLPAALLADLRREQIPADLLPLLETATQRSPRPPADC